ncbi:MAG: RnfABCDGE type electron transport complex subunit G [Candidatus Margulisiibacteriota bacterium]
MNKIVRMIVVLGVIGLISGGTLALVYQWALPKIIENQIRETKAAIFKVLPETRSYKKVVKDELTYFECFDDRGERAGTAILCKGNGYQGEIKLMVGVNADFTKFTGLTILEQVETPGLGAKIAERKFFKQFKDLATKPPIAYVKGRPPEKPNQIQAITGATISSRAVVNIINKTVKEWLEIQ